MQNFNQCGFLCNVRILQTFLVTKSFEENSITGVFVLLKQGCLKYSNEYTLFCTFTSSHITRKNYGAVKINQWVLQPCSVSVIGTFTALTYDNDKQKLRLLIISSINIVNYI